MSAKAASKSVLFIAFTGLVISAAMLIFDVRLFTKTEPFKKNLNNFNVKWVQYRFQIWNTQNQPVTNAHFYVRAPLEQTCAQRCIEIESSYPYEVITDTLGNRVLKYTFKMFPPLASKVVSIRAKLMLATSPVASAKIKPLKSVDSNTEALNISKLADQLKSKTVHTTALNIHRWVANNITYTGYLKHAKGARQTLVSKKGDCTEFADLFVALAQAVNIPTRRVSGYLTHENGVLKPSDFHDWAEFYANGVWRIADPQQKNFDANYSSYIAVKILDRSSKNSPMFGFYRFYVDGNGLTAKMMAS
jgi:hypothetical protein